ncbi:MAG: hypothetical protein LC742_00290 [Acidobacteria bacterium]|nr:hypothetical protein [Acidobacteriota bacterium]
MLPERNAPGTVATCAGAMKNAALAENSRAFAPDDSAPSPASQRCETCAHCRQFRQVRGWVFAPVCEPCYADECARVERNRA